MRTFHLCFLILLLMMSTGYAVEETPETFRGEYFYNFENAVLPHSCSWQLSFGLMDRRHEV